MDERELIKRAQAGDFTAFQALVEPHQKRLYALAKKMTGNQQDAEDIVQETLLKAIDKIDQFRAESSFGTWLYSITLNAGRQYLVHQRRQEMKPIEDLLESPMHDHQEQSLREWRNPHTVMESNEIGRHIAAAIAQLPAEYSVPFALRYDEELSIKEIAQMLKLSEAATKSRILRARLFLRDKLDAILRIEEGNEEVR
jgi:RNA polymerase sigma-70 factor, ECF subfamily